MGSPPPSAGVSVTETSAFGPSQKQATVCGFGFGLPRIKIGISITLPFSFPPAIPLPHIALALSCDPNAPVKVDAGLKWGAGRKPNVLPDPDDDDST